MKMQSAKQESRKGTSRIEGAPALGRLALFKGEGEGEGFLRATCSYLSPPNLISRADCQSRLSLSQRERSEARDYFQRASRVRTISPLERYPIPDEFDDSRIAAPRFRGEREILLAHGRVSIRLGSYDRRHPTRSPALQQVSRSRVCKAGADADDEICKLQNSDCVAGARERVPTSLDACAGNERDSQSDLTRLTFSGKDELTPHLSPLPLSKGRGDINRRVSAAQFHGATSR
jgi:hypothetical protein